MLHSSADLCAPIHPRGHAAAVPFEPDLANVYFLNTENGPTGWYPVGRGRTWHPGVHLWAERGSPVYAMAPGRVIAARLTRAAEEEDRPFGSRGFVLMQHEARLPDRDEPLVFYALYHGLSWSDAARAEVPWLQAYPAPGGDAASNGAATVGPDAGDLARLTQDETLYRYEGDAEPYAYLKAGTIVEWDSSPRPDDTGQWRRVRIHKAQCPRPQRHEHHREFVTGWLWTDAPQTAYVPLQPTGQTATVGVENLRLRRAPAKGLLPPVTAFREDTEVERLSATTVGPDGLSWQAVRVQLGENLDDATAEQRPFVPTEDRGAWAYGWVYDGDRYSAPSLQSSASSGGDTARALHGGEIAGLDEPVQAGEPIGEVGPLEEDPWGPFGADYGVHVEIFLAEDPTEALACPAGDWIVAKDDTGDDVLCASEQVETTAGEDGHLLEYMYDRFVQGFSDAGFPGNRHPSRVEDYRSTVVRCTSPWAMDWTKAADENPEWAAIVGMTDAHAEAMQEHAWWDQVPSEVPLPERTGGKALVWHVHPIRWLEALSEALPGERIAPYLTNDQTLQRSASSEGVTDGEDVRALQEDLRQFGFDFGPIDGTYGPGTQAAVVCLQIETYYHVVDGRLSVDALADPDADAPTQEDWIDGWYVDGVVGDGTKRAIRAWIEAGLTAEYPREINIATEDPRGEMGYLMLDRTHCDDGVYHYQSGAEGDQVWRDEIEWWGMPPIVYALERVCRKWAEAGHPTIQIGDMTRPQGGTYWRLTDEEYQDDGHEDTVTGEKVEGQKGDRYSEPQGDDWYKIDHRSHERGWGADIRPMVGSEEEVGHPLEVGDDAYDQDLSHAFLEMLDAEAPQNRGKSMLNIVLIRDRTLSDLSFVRVPREGHADHYHVKFTFTPP